MPEGDTVWLAATNLDRALGRQVLELADLRVPAFATVDLTGREVLEVRSRGKHILTRMSGGLTLHTHFKMEGSWHLYRAGARWGGGPDDQVRALLGTSAWTAVGYRLGIVEVVRTAQEDAVVGHLGPDLLGTDWDLDEALARIRDAPDRAIGEALLDQRNVAGIGTVYRAETLFLSGVSPWRTVGEVPTLPRVLDLAHRLLRANRDTAAQVTTGDTRRGHELWVYGRARLPCRRCGTTVRSAQQGDPPRERISFWCPRCQPE
jgi:endonuclease-8